MPDALLFSNGYTCRDPEGREVDICVLLIINLGRWEQGNSNMVKLENLMT